MLDLRSSVASGQAVEAPARRRRAGSPPPPPPGRGNPPPRHRLHGPDGPARPSCRRAAPAGPRAGLQADAERLGQPLDRPLEVEEVELDLALPGVPTVPPQTRPTCSGWSGSGSPGSAGVEDAWRSRTGAPRPSAPALVEAGGLDQVRHQRAAHHRVAARRADWRAAAPASGRRLGKAASPAGSRKAKWIVST